MASVWKLTLFKGKAWHFPAWTSMWLSVLLCDFQQEPNGYHGCSQLRQNWVVYVKQRYLKGVEEFIQTDFNVSSLCFNHRLSILSEREANQAYSVLVVPAQSTLPRSHCVSRWQPEAHLPYYPSNFTPQVNPASSQSQIFSSHILIVVMLHKCFEHVISVLHT